MEFDAIVLAGGRSSRMGSAKSALLFEGRPLVELAVEAARDARTVVVVGPDELAPAGVLTARESPALGGPAAALVAGVDTLARLVDGPAAWLLVLACDLPRVGEAVRALLAEAPPHTDGACEAVVAVDDSGRRQPLLAVYRTDALVRAAASARSSGDLAGLPLRRLVGGLHTVEVAVDDALCADVDTPEQARSFGIDVPRAAGAALI
ncbi:molybdopterin-guanine dinucleotide biosynthesis protein A [Conyzicola nivalis]|uniref:Molybdopterin-guanine dinucleotide biosynthesis protein A n=1 Tax=Conyzicola nivalis TaxID=1477021 RepID=A0ABV2QNH2_9MICO